MNAISRLRLLCAKRRWAFSDGACSAVMVALLPLALLIGGTEWGHADDLDDGDALQIFEQRIMPIFRSPNPSSCVQCHLSAVDIKDYILPSHRDTFLSLRKNGLIDLQSPQESKILTLIEMGSLDRDPMARRLHEKTRQAEYDAFAAWIRACCSDPSLTSVAIPDQLATVGPTRPLAVVRHGRKSRLVQAFADKIWSQRMRCFPCHTPHEIDPGNPNHEKPAERQRELVKTYGTRMNLFGKTPEATLSAMIASSRKAHADRYPMINVEQPAKSLLVLKPTAKLPTKLADGSFEKPSSTDPVTHMGGLKMHVDDHSYKLFLSWLEDYAAVVGDRYRDVDDLPKEHWRATENVIRVKGVPQQWPAGTVAQLFVYSRGDGAETWSDRPIAFTQGIITPRRFVGGALLLLDDAPLTPGRHRVEVYLDRSGTLERSPTALLNEVSDVAGQATFESQWTPGFRNATVIDGNRLSVPAE